MSCRRKAANPIFSRPLTIAEADKNRETKQPVGRPILCYRCGQGGGTLVKLGDNQYRHQVCPSEESL